MSEGASLLPDGLAIAVEAAAAAHIVRVTPRGGGGASREGAELALAWPDGRTANAYMNYDVNRAGAGDDAAFLREAAVLRALSGPLAASGVRVARFIAAVPELRALITEKVGGDAVFNRVTDPVQRSAVAADMMGQLASLHALPADSVRDLGPITPIRDAIEQRLAATRSYNDAHGRSPLIMLALRWLAANIPAEPERQVIVHGDAGPGNFLFERGQVTAMLDWELVHIGDPMADMAMLCLRMLFQPFVPLPQAFAAYESAGGGAVDVGRVRYWRLLFQTGFAGRARFDDPAAPPPPNLGMNMVYSMIHRRVLAEALAEASGVSLPAVELSDATAGAYDRSFQIALDDLRDMIVPRLSDEQAAVKAKGMARLIKWWRAIDRNGAAFAAAECAELSTALGKSFGNLAQARAALSDAVHRCELSDAAALRLCYAGIVRDAALMADAMGSLSQTHFAPLG